MAQLKTHRLYENCYGESWAAISYCGLKVLRSTTTCIDSETTCRNCLRILAARKERDGR
jgi:hypothetical protein